MFRAHFAPRRIRSGLQFNYHNLIEIAIILEEKYQQIDMHDADAMNKFRLLARQVYGFVLRRLPACDRQAFAQSIFGIVEEKRVLKRGSTPSAIVEFPPTPDDQDRNSIGFDTAVDAKGKSIVARARAALPGRLQSWSRRKCCILKTTLLIRRHRRCQWLLILYSKRLSRCHPEGVSDKSYIK